MISRFLKVWLVLIGASVLIFSGPGNVAGAQIFAPDDVEVNVIDDKPVLVPDEILVKFKKGVTETRKTNFRKAFGLKKVRESRKAGKYTLFRHSNPKAMLAKLRKDSSVEFAEQNAYAYAFGVPDDTYYRYQWHLKRIDMEGAWDLSTGDGVTVAVVDTGVRQNLTDFDRTRFVAGWDFINNDNDPTDDNGHGSHVAGTIAQSTNNTKGVCGVAFQASIMPVKVLNSSGSGTYAQIIDGINWAVDNGASIINLSLGGSTSSVLLEDAVNSAWNRGVLLVCAAGNSNTNKPHYPAAYANTISVSATAGNDTLASYSNYGPTIDIAAPGGDSGDYNRDGYPDKILQNTFSGTSTGYYWYSGTSMACPHVVGVAALIKSKKPELTNVEIRDILFNTADDIGYAGKDTAFGYGMVNALNALQYVESLEPKEQNPNADFSHELAWPVVTFSDKSTDDGSIVSWSWDFGDGESDTSANPVHTYASSGKYNVALTVTDDIGLSGSVTKEVTVNQLPQAAFTANSADRTVTFSDSSSDNDGSIVSWSWNFGDGQSSTSQNPQHTYAGNSTSFTVSLTVTDDLGGTNTASQEVTVAAPVNQSPVAAFTYSAANLVVTFTDKSTDDGSIVSWSWNFGDGQTSTTRNPQCTYGAAGTYTVTLAVTDNLGATGSVSQDVTVTAPVNQNPVAAFTYSAANLVVTFTDNSTDDGSIVSWAWNFGNGQTSTTRNPQCTYGAAGTYTVTLIVTDNLGATGSVSQNVTVTAPATNAIFVGNLSLSVVRQLSRYYGRSTVTIKDANGNLIRNARVYISWSGVVSGSYSGVTSSSGTITFTSGTSRSTGPFTITVTNVTHSTLKYDSTRNVLTTRTASY
jgi:serine protease